MSKKQKDTLDLINIGIHELNKLLREGNLTNKEFIAIIHQKVYVLRNEMYEELTGKTNEFT